MAMLLLGLLMFFSVHTLTTLRATRGGLIQRLGENRYKSLYSVVALLGFALIVWGYGRYRSAGPVEIWFPPLWTHILTIILMWFAFIALASMNPAPSRIRGWLRHPMLVAIKLWAFAHLLANGDAASLLLFGSFLAWAIYDRVAVKQRGDFGAPRLPSFTRADAIVLATGTAAFLAMLFLHRYLIGVPVVV